VRSNGKFYFNIPTGFDSDSSVCFLCCRHL